MIYESSKKIIEELEKEVNMPIQTLKEKVKNTEITLTEEEIRTFLKQFEELDFKTKEELANRVIISFFPKKSDFDVFTLNYFKKYVSILKEKSLLLITIIECIGSNDISKVEDYIKNLDIDINNTKILKDDITRLIKPTIYNIENLEKYSKRGNDLNTYVDFKLTEHYLADHGVFGEEIYPSKELQLSSVEADTLYGDNGYVRLSKNQIEEKEEIFVKTLDAVAQIIKDF